ncbi:MAG: ATPase [Ruminococcus sp.]|nr:ATPase [Ruminococcus sp.]
MDIKERLAGGRTSLGIEFGSTRIKCCLIGEDFAPIAAGEHCWENRLEDGVWTYTREDIVSGLQSAYASLKKDVKDRYGVTLTAVGAMGISAMMHGYLAFDEKDELLVPFRTWRNTMTAQAAEKLTALFGFNVPQRYSIAHLYQAVLNGEEHIDKIAHINTLAGFVHFLLTGERKLGIGDASGMFPVRDGGYNSEMAGNFSALPEIKERSWELTDILPQPVRAGEICGRLTEAGAELLDPEGDLKEGIPFAPPEGDAGTGMTATNAVRPGTGNVSAGTSVFSMIVLDEPLKGCYPEIDVVTTPDGAEVAMVHCNNCCGELDAWVKMFAEFLKLSDREADIGEVYSLLYKNAMTAPEDCGGIVAYNYISAEPVTGAGEKGPSYMRSPDSSMDLAKFFRAELYGALAALKYGNDILTEREGRTARSLTGHGGLFKVRGAAQQVLADALGCPVSVMSTAGEGGAWGMALLAAFAKDGGGALADWLDGKVFAGMEAETLAPTEAGIAGWKRYMEGYRRGLERYRSEVRG